MGEHVFFVGIGGSGMSVLAKYLVYNNQNVSGSDREHDRGLRDDFYTHLKELGISLYPQDGSGINSTISHVVTSTAVEAQIPDILAALQHDIPLRHRSVELASIVNPSRSIAIAGTSGKSTVTGMLGWILVKNDKDPSILSGAAVPTLNTKELETDCRFGKSGLIIFEADESDGSLVQYTPALGLIHNISKDHKPLNELREIFSVFARQTRETLLVNADCPETRSIQYGSCPVLTYGFDHSSHFRASDYRSSDWTSSFCIENHLVHISIPGRHNATNALAAYAIARTLDIPQSNIIEALATFPGIRRRFEKIGSARNITVVDDFGHNPDKIRATLRTASSLSSRRIVIFQPHGFGPTRFLQEEICEAFVEELNQNDILVLTPIFYAGGTVTRDFDSEMLAQIISKRRSLVYVKPRSDIPDYCAAIAKPNDLIIVMGARDPSLTQFATSILHALEK